MSVLDELVESLLYEGYALYPYTPGATKNATPTPFGIVYPPAYAAGSAATFARLELRGLLSAPPGASLEASIRFLRATGERHEGAEGRIELEPAAVAGLAERAQHLDVAFPPLRGRVELAAERVEPGLWRVMLRLENATPPADGARAPTRSEALTRAFVSTHALLRVHGGRFVSPLEAEGCESVNTCPVLATPGDDALLGAAIVLPDHPQLAPQSRGSLFDATEIEEALLLHVHTLSDGEREAIAGQDPLVRETVERAQGSTAEDLLALHGVMRPVEPEAGGAAGEEETVVDGVRFSRGASVVLRLGGRVDLYDRMLDGRTATLERIYLDYEGKVYLGVTVDSDPMREVMRDAGRYLFFFADEVEVTG